MMLDMTKDQRTIAKQRERIEELEETIRQMREEATPKKSGTSITASAFPIEWKLTRALSQILAALYNAPAGFVERGRLAQIACVNRIPEEDDHLHNLLSVQIVRLRRLLKPLGVEINTIHGCGHELPPASKAIIKEALERRAQV